MTPPQELDVNDLMGLLDDNEYDRVRAHIATLSFLELDQLLGDVGTMKAEDEGDADRLDDNPGDMVADQWRRQHKVYQRQRELYREAMVEKHKNDPATLQDVLARYGFEKVAQSNTRWHES